MEGQNVQLEDIWQAVLGEIEVSLSRGSFVTWFKNTCLLKHDEELTIIGVSNIFVKQHLEKKYGGLISATLQKQGIPAENIEYKITPMVSRGREHSEDKDFSDQQLPNMTESPTIQTSSQGLRQNSNGLNERYTLDNFVVGDGNELAFAACQAVTQQPGTKYNPLYLYGGVGIGKTHLIQAVGNALQKRNPDAKVLYIATEQFVREFVQSLRGRTAATFASNYRSADRCV